jgi:hypothetical protein
MHGSSLISFSLHSASRDHMPTTGTSQPGWQASKTLREPCRAAAFGSFMPKRPFHWTLQQLFPTL